MKVRNVGKICLAFFCLTLLVAAPGLSFGGSATKEFLQNVEDSTKKAASSTAEYLDDSRITTQIKALFLDETNLDSLDISVGTEDGLVTLTGMVKTQEQIDLAGKIAAGVKGVKGVRNRLVFQ